MKKEEFFARMRHWLTFILFLTLVFSYFYKNNYKAISNFDNRSLSAPTQVAVTDKTPIQFDKYNYHYNLTPLYNYTLTGLVLHVQKYDTWYSLSRTDKTFTKDICLVWGDSLKSKSFQDKTFSVSQDFRFCMFSYFSPNLVFKGDEMSNNHLIASSPAVEKQILLINSGDQVRIKGKLVNVHITALGRTKPYESKEGDWTTSITRQDSGAGACEVVYVESVEILKVGHPIFRILYLLCWSGLILIFFWWGVKFFNGMRNI